MKRFPSFFKKSKNNFTLLPKPEKDINWGMQSVENEKAWKQWIADNIEKFIHFTYIY